MVSMPQHAAEFRTDGYWKGPLLIDYFDAAAPQNPPKTANIDGSRAHTRREMAAAVEAIAGGQLSLDVEAGDTVSIQVPNRYEGVVAHVAAQRIGALSNPLVPIYRDREVGYMARKVRSEVMFIPGSFRKFDYVGADAQMAEAGQ